MPQALLPGTQVVGEGGLRKVRGVFVASKAGSSIITVLLRAIGSEAEPLEVHHVKGVAREEIEFNLVPVPSSEVTESLQGWERAMTFEEMPPMRKILKLYYGTDAQTREVTTDASMVSATSGDDSGAVAQLQGGIEHLKIEARNARQGERSCPQGDAPRPEPRALGDASMLPQPRMPFEGIRKGPANWNDSCTIAPATIVQLAP